MSELEAQPLRIVSDGTCSGTTLFCGDTPISNVYKAEWSIRVDGLAKATIYCQVVKADVQGTGAVVEDPDR